MSTVNISRADVVVIGGGIFGCCAAYHLRQAGVGTVVLLERAPELATETSWAGAGFVALWSACADDATLELELEHYALQFYQELAAKQPIGLKRIGMVWIAQTAAGSAIQVRQYEAARRHVRADDVQLLTPEQVGSWCRSSRRRRLRQGCTGAHRCDRRAGQQAGQHRLWAHWTGPH